MGIAFSLTFSQIWPDIAYIIRKKILGRAYGNFFMKIIFYKKKIMFSSLSFISLIFAIFSYSLDAKQGHNLEKKEKKQGIKRV
jgi:hypothetical protein